MIFKSLASLVYPSRCIGCDAWFKEDEEPSVCPACLDKLHFLKTPAFLPDLKVKYFDEAFSCLAYEGLTLEWIHQFKYGRKFYLVKSLGHFLHRQNLDWDQYDFLMFVPLHWWRLMRRGFNPSHFLAFELKKRIKKLIFTCLKRASLRPPQTKLSKEERLKNVQGSFSLSKKFLPKIKAKKFLLMDDVLTTGATVNECARVLKKAKAAKVDVLTVARTL